MHSAISIPNMEDIMELSASDVQQLLTHHATLPAGGALSQDSYRSDLTPILTEQRAATTPSRSRQGRCPQHLVLSGTGSSTSHGAPVPPPCPPQPPSVFNDWLSTCVETGDGKPTAAANPARHHAADLQCDEGITPLSDTAILRAERDSLHHTTQESWLHQSLHYRRWDAELVRRGTSYRPTPIAARTQVTMSHTKSLCLALNINPALLGTVHEDAKQPVGEDVIGVTPQSVGTDAAADGCSISPLFMWQSPASIPGDVNTVLAQLGEQLEEQYNALAMRPLPTAHCANARVSDMGQALSEARKGAGIAKVIIHYYARGVPACRGGTLFLMNSSAGASSYSPYSKLPLDTLRARVGSPLVFIADSADAGEIMKDFLRNREEQEQRQQFLSRDHQLNRNPSRTVSATELDGLSDAGASQRGSPLGNRRGGSVHGTAVRGVYNDFYFIGATGGDRPSSTVAQHPHLPSDILTSCLTTPVRLALVWYMVGRPELRSVHPVLLHILPGALKDKKTPLGQLQWYFQGITECIAWSTFTLATFSRLFQEDVYVAPLYRGYLLAERVITGGLGSSLSVYPPLPPTHTHAVWDVWDNLVERACVAALKLIRPAPRTRLTTLEVRDWLDVRATRWKYEQQQWHHELSDHLEGHKPPPQPTSGRAEVLPTTLPTFVEGPPLVLPNFFHEELRSLEAVVERVTQQSFFLTLPHSVARESDTPPPSNLRCPASTILDQLPLPAEPSFCNAWPRGDDYRNVSLQTAKDATPLSEPLTPAPSVSSSQCQRFGQSHSEFSPIHLMPQLVGGPPSNSPQRSRPSPKEEYVNNHYVLSSNTPASLASPATFPFLERLPILLQGLLVLAFREKATELVCRLVDIGSPAVLQCAEMNMYRIVLYHYWTRQDLRYLMPATLFIFSKSCYVDPELIGSGSQRDTAIKVCTEVLQCPIRVPVEENEPGAWQSDVLGPYATDVGQRLLAVSLLSIMAMHSADGREACHRCGVFELCCHLLSASADHNPVLFHRAGTVGGGRSSTGPGVGSGRAAHYSGLIELPRATGDEESDHVDTLYRLALVTLFMALLHGLDLAEEDEATSQGPYTFVPFDGEVHPLPPTTRRGVQASLQAAHRPLALMLYSPTSVLRGVALKGLSMVLISPVAEEEMKSLYVACLLSRLYEDPVPPFECNTDVRLEVTGAAYSTFRFLLNQLTKEMPLDEIRDYVAGWIYQWFTYRKQGLKLRVPELDGGLDPFSPAQHGVGGGADTDTDAADSPLSEVIPRSNHPPSTPASTHRSRSLFGWKQRTLSMSQSLAQATCVRIGNPNDVFLPLLSNLIRLLLDHNQHACPYVAAHARKVVLEEFSFLQMPWFDHHSRGGAFANQTPHLYAAEDTGALRSADSDRASLQTFTSSAYMGSTTHGTAADDHPATHRRYVAGLLKKVAETADLSSAGGGRYNLYYRQSASGPSPQRGVAASLTGLLRFSHKSLQPDNITLRAVTAQDSTTVFAVVYAGLGYLQDLLLIKHDDYDPRNPFYLGMETGLYMYIQHAACCLRLASMEAPMTASGPSGGDVAGDEAFVGDDTTKTSHRGADATPASTTAFALLCEATPNVPSASGETILGMRFHPVQPHVVSFNDRGFLQVWRYSAELAGKPSLTSLARYHVADVLARQGSVVPPGVQLRYAYASEAVSGEPEVTVPSSYSVDQSRSANAGGVGTSTAYNPAFNGISGIHLVDAAYHTMLCSVRRTGSVELFSGYTCNRTVRRVSTFETMLLDDGMSVHDCLSSYQHVSKLLHVSSVDGSVGCFDLGYERLLAVGYGRGAYAAVPSVLAAHPYEPSFFAVGAGPVYVYDRRVGGARAASVFNATSDTETSLCLHVHFSGRYPHLLVSGYSGPSAPIVLWDDRRTAQPLEVLPTRVPSARQEDSGGLHTVRHMDVHPYSRRLCTLTVTSETASLTERRPADPLRPFRAHNVGVASVVHSPAFNLPHEAGAACFHRFAPLFALGCGNCIMLYGSPAA